MSIWSRWLPAVVVAVLLTTETVRGCPTCGQAPCVIVPAPVPAFTCVTEMVPITIMKTKTNVDLVPVCTKTVMETKIDTVYDEQTQNVCKVLFDTVFETHCTTVCRPVCETTMVCQSYTVCRPVTTTDYVTEYCLKAYTELVPATCGITCGRVGSHGGGYCNAVARTCYKRVPVVREVTRTNLVTEIHTQMVPTVRWRTVAEQKVERVPVTSCRIVNDVVRIKVPRLVFRYEPKTFVYKTAVLTCEEIPVTVYRPVVKMVPVVEPSPQAMPTSQASANASDQAGLSSDERMWTEKLRH
jgi:hypothetical protein